MMNEEYRKVRKEFQYKGQAINYWSKLLKNFKGKKAWFEKDDVKGIWVIEMYYAK